MKEALLGEHQWLLLPQVLHEGVQYRHNVDGNDLAALGIKWV
jgi:hypothetical protein